MIVNKFFLVIYQTAEDGLVRHELYTKYKTAPSEEEQEKARQEYLDKRGVSADTVLADLKVPGRAQGYF